MNSTAKAIVIVVLGASIAGIVYFFTPSLKKQKVTNPENVEVTQPEPEGLTEELQMQPEGVQVGDKAPDFRAKTPEGKELSLNDVLDKKGKVTVIEFWASWCPYCRAEMPNVSKIYKKYHDEGLEIIGVSIDENQSDWQEAIKNFDMNWAHISNLSEWEDPIVEQYGVRSIPSNFILDAEGTVVAEDLKGDDLEEQIAKMLKD